jgi:phage-related minor tail protein
VSRSSRPWSDTETQIDQITAKLKDGLKVTLDADTSRFDKAMADLDKALAEKEFCWSSRPIWNRPRKSSRNMKQLLKEGKTLPVDADVTQAKAALDKLTAYAKQNSLIELQVTSEKAQAAIINVEGMINALGRIRTESQHSVNTNADSARSEISSLNGMNTSSTHTIYVTKVETNATGGLVGAGVPHFAGRRMQSASPCCVCICPHDRWFGAGLG